MGTQRPDSSLPKAERETPSHAQPPALMTKRKMTLHTQQLAQRVLDLKDNADIIKAAINFGRRPSGVGKRIVS